LSYNKRRAIPGPWVQSNAETIETLHPHMDSDRGRATESRIPIFYRKTATQVRVCRQGLYLFQDKQQQNTKKRRVSE
jgi:hypothetical protein